MVLKLKSPYRDGTTHIVMSPLEFLQRLAALVPRPRMNLIRYFGVLAPNAKLRGQVVPKVQDEAVAGAGEEAPVGSGGIGCHGRSRASLRFAAPGHPCPMGALAEEG